MVTWDIEMVIWTISKSRFPLSMSLSDLEISIPSTSAEIFDYI